MIGLIKKAAWICLPYLLLACGEVSDGAPNENSTQRIVVQTPKRALEVGESLALSAYVVQDNGKVIYPESGLGWQVSDNSLATIDTEGLLLALKSGAVAISATYQGVSSEPLSISIKAVYAVDQLAITVLKNPLLLGETTTASATATLLDSTSLTVVDDISWFSSDNEVATVNQFGTIAAKGAGVADIWAVHAGVTSQKQRITVVDERPVTLVSIQLSTFPTELQPGESATASVSLTYSDGTVETKSDALNWQSLNPHVATVNQNAEISALQPGRTAIKVSDQAVYAEGVLDVVGAIHSHNNVSVKTHRFVDNTIGQSDMVIRDGFAYVIYSDSSISDNYNGRIAKIELSSGAVTRGAARFLTIGWGDKSHNGSAIALDGEGYIHAWIGMHNHQMRYYRSKTPYNIDTFDNLSNQETFTSFDESYDDWENLPTPEDNNQTYYSFIKEHPSTNLDLRLYSYPQAASLSNGDVVFMARRSALRLNNGSIAGSQTGEKQDFYHYDHKLKKWREYGLMAQAGRNAYMSRMYADNHNQVHIVTAWSQRHSGDNTFQRGTYVKYDNENQRFTKADGTALSLPIAVDNTNNSDHFYPYRRPWHDLVTEIQTPQITVNSKGHPIISYPININDKLNSIDGGEAVMYHRDFPDYRINVASWSGTQWLQWSINSEVNNHERPPLSFTQQKVHIHTRAPSDFSHIYSSNDDGLSFLEQFSYGHDKSPTKVLTIDETTEVLLNARSIKVIRYGATQ